jgi:hypothetical protein
MSRAVTPAPMATPVTKASNGKRELNASML